MIGQCEIFTPFQNFEAKKKKVRSILTARPDAQAQLRLKPRRPESPVGKFASSLSLSLSLSLLRGEFAFFLGQEENLPHQADRVLKSSDPT